VVNGANARYTPVALTRARAARAMRELCGMSLPAIRQDLLTANDAKIESDAGQAGAAGDEALPGSPITALSPSPPAGTTAADYLRNLRSIGIFGAELSKVADRSAASGARLLASATSPKATPFADRPV
jgi:hypothetical protein